MFQSAKARLLTAYNTLQSTLPASSVEDERLRLLSQFPPNRLATLRGRELLEFFHGQQPREGLFYNLEYGGTNLGNIWGGSSLKFKVYRAENGEWRMKGKGNVPVPCSQEQAISITEYLASDLGNALALVDNLGLQDGNFERWREFDQRVSQASTELSPNDGGRNSPTPQLGWAHKYLAIVYPDLFSFHHKKDILANHLVQAGIEPLDGRYLLDWQWRQLRLEDDALRSCHPAGLMHAAYSEEAFGSGVRYWRVGTDEGDVDRWPAMRNGGFASVGWYNLGDLQVALEGLGETEARKRLIELLKADYADRKPQVIGKWAGQIYAFYALMRPGDRIVAMKGLDLLGVGEIASPYFHRDDLQPHQRQVEWREVTPFKWEGAPGLRTSVYDFTEKHPDALYVERLVDGHPTVLPSDRTASTVAQPPSPTPLPPAVPLTALEQRIGDVLERKGQVILYGPPGTGKTYHARRTARELLARDGFQGRSWAQLSPIEQDKVDGCITFCTFHPAYTYEEFIEGYRPVVTPNGATFERRDGLFVEACNQARAQEGYHVLIVDEINRANVAAVMGELLTLLEADKRDTLKVRLPVSRDEFSVPRNLWIIGTMNTADRSISLLDAALRRRFGFVELMPEPDRLEARVSELRLSSLLQVLNAHVRRHVPRNARELQIGHAYFLREGKPLDSKRQLQHVMRDDVIPLLSEYCFENPETLCEILGETLVDTQEGGLRREVVENEDLLYAALCELVGLDSALNLAPLEDDEGGEDASASLVDENEEDGEHEQ